MKENGPAKPWPKARIGRVFVTVSMILSALVFTPGVLRSQTITIAGDADQGDQGRWMKAKVEEFSKETGIKVRYIGRPLSTTETLMLWQQDWAAQTVDVDVYLIDVIWPAIAAPRIDPTVFQRVLGPVLIRCLSIGTPTRLPKLSCLIVNTNPAVAPLADFLFSQLGLVNLTLMASTHRRSPQEILFLATEPSARANL